jgi:hypothetical protein
MPSLRDTPEFKIDVRRLLKDARRTLNKRVGKVQISLPPNITYVLEPHDPEITIARKILVFTRDRRVLSSEECCDGCIDRSIESLGKIREYLVERQQELVHLSDGVLFLLTEHLVDAIRQFMTYAERLDLAYHEDSHASSAFRRHPGARHHYFEALKRLRAHILQTLHQLALVAKIDFPKVPDNLRITNWDSSRYILDEAQLAHE